MAEASSGVVRVRDCSLVSFEAFLQFLYTGGIEEATVLMADAGELWLLADLFGCDALQKKMRQVPPRLALPSSISQKTRNSVHCLSA